MYRIIPIKNYVLENMTHTTRTNSAVNEDIINGVKNLKISITYSNQIFGS